MRIDILPIVLVLHFLFMEKPKKKQQVRNVCVNVKPYLGHLRFYYSRKQRNKERLLVRLQGPSAAVEFMIAFPTFSVGGMLEVRTGDRPCMLLLALP